MEKVHLRHDATVFIIVTKLHPSKDPLHIVPVFTREFYYLLVDSIVRNLIIDIININIINIRIISINYSW